MQNAYGFYNLIPVVTILHCYSNWYCPIRKLVLVFDTMTKTLKRSLNKTFNLAIFVLVCLNMLRLPMSYATLVKESNKSIKCITF